MRASVSTAGIITGTIALLATMPAGAQGTIGSKPPSLNHPIPPGLVCTAEALNVSGFVDEEGHLAVANIPSSGGQFRVRVTCEDLLGNTFTGYSELVEPVPGGVIEIDSVTFDDAVPVPASLSIDPSSLTLVGLGTTQQLSVTATFASGGPQDLTAGSTGTTYTVSNPAVASVDPDGLVTALGTGSAIVTATHEGNVGFALLSVLSDTLVGLEVNPDIVVFSINPLFGSEPIPLLVTGQLGDGSTVDLTSGLSGTTYISSTPAVAAVNQDGLIVGLQAGITTVTVSNGSQSAEVTVTVDSFSPEPVAAFTTQGFAHNVAIGGTLAFVADGSGGLQVIDASPPPAGGIIGALAFPGLNAVDVQVRGALAAVALEGGGVSVIDISEPSLPAELGRISGFSATDLWLSGERLYVAASGGLRVYDIADPAAPVLLGTQTFPSNVRAVAGDGATGVAVALTDAPALEVVQAGGAPPWPAVTIPLPSATNQADDVALFGTSAFVANGRAGLHKVDVTDPANPVLESNSTLNFNALGVAVRQTERGVLVGAADNIFVNAVPLFDENLNTLLTVDFSTFPGVIRADANGTGIDLGEGFGVVTVGGDGVQVFRTEQLTDNAGVPPVVAITRPATGSAVPEGTLVFVEAVASDDVQVALVRFFVDEAEIGTDVSAPYMTIFSVGPVGTVHTIQAEAADIGGNSSASLPVTVQVVEPPADLTILSASYIDDGCGTCVSGTCAAGTPNAGASCTDDVDCGVGDCDAFPDTGESGTLDLSIANNGVSLTDAIITLESDDEDVACITNPTVPIGSLAAGASTTVAGFRFTASNDLESLPPPGTIAQITVCITVVANETLGIRAPTCVSLLADLNAPAGGSQVFTKGDDGLANTGDDGIFTETFDIDRNLNLEFESNDTFRQAISPGVYRGHCNTDPTQICDTVGDCLGFGVCTAGFCTAPAATAAAPAQACGINADCDVLTGDVAVCYEGEYIQSNQTGVGLNVVAAITCGGMDDPATTPQCRLEPNQWMDWHFHCPIGATNCKNLETGPVGACGTLSGTTGLTCYNTPGGDPGGHHAVSAPNSLHMGAHFDQTDNLAGDTSHLRSMMGFQSAPVNMAVLPTNPGGPGVLEMSFFHIARLMDNNGVGPGTKGQCVDCADVQVRVDANPDKSIDAWGFWDKLVPFQNVYDHKAQAWSVFGGYYCRFTPTDTGSAPPSPKGRKETMCFPLGVWSHCGSTIGTTVGTTVDCAGSPFDVVDPVDGTGVWAQTRFNLDGFLGQRIQFRWIAATWHFGVVPSAPTYFEIGPGWNVTQQDDGWWLDNIVIQGTIEEQLSAQPDTTLRTGSCP